MITKSGANCVQGEADTFEQAKSELDEAMEMLRINKDYGFELYEIRWNRHHDRFDWHAHVRRRTWGNYEEARSPR